MIISNYTQLASSPERMQLLQLADAGISSVLPSLFMRQNLRVEGEVLHVKCNRVFDLKDRRVFVIGAGKASAAMAVELEETLGPDRITAGTVISNDNLGSTRNIDIHRGGHPLPTEDSIEGTARILSMKRRFDLTLSDTIIALISGGGSSMMSFPVQGISLKDKRALISLMLENGMNVHEMTAVKKKVSAVKGGKLARYFAPTPVIVLVLSDVVDNDVSVIASGPFSVDEGSFQQSIDLLMEYEIADKVPSNIMGFLQENVGRDGPCEISLNVDHAILADNNTALAAIRDLSTRQGIDVVMQTGLQGEAKEVAADICSNIQRHKISKATLFLYGGETTVSLPETHGDGGRNQEFVVACLNHLKRTPFSDNWCLLAIGTDGVDFIDDSCGGIIDHSSLENVISNGIDLGAYLEKHDSFHLLERLHSTITVDGTTGTNVGDIMMVLVKPKVSSG